MPTKLTRKQFLLNDEESAKIDAEAAKQGLSVSNLTRKLYGLKPLSAGGKREKKEKEKTK